MRLIIVPQLKISMRYTEWWPELFSQELNKEFYSPGQWKVEMLVGRNGKYRQQAVATDSLFVFQSAIVNHELAMVKELQGMNLHARDIILCLDVCTPGIVASYLQNLPYGKRPLCLGICHGSSFNSNDMYEGSRNVFDLACMSVFSQIFVATNYHKEKLTTAFSSFRRNIHTEVFSLNGLPDNPKLLDMPATNMGTNAVAIIDRHGQKRNKEMVHAFRNKYFAEFDVNDIYGLSSTWDGYHENLKNHRFVLVTTSEETYGYQVRDAMLNGCIPICPNAFSFRELLNPVCLYSPEGENVAENIYKAMKASENYLEDNLYTYFPTVSLFAKNNSSVDNFFPNLAKEIREIVPFWLRSSQPVEAEKADG